MKLVKDSIWNFLSIIIPGLVAIPVFSLISKNLGLELFGVYTLSFAIVGYASIFDLGISRAIVREVAINREDIIVIANYLNTATTLVTLFSIVASIMLFCLSSILVSIINVSLEYFNEVVEGIKILAICIPLMLISNIWLSYFEGSEQFQKLSYFKIISSLLTVLLPLGMLHFQSGFKMLTIGLLIARIITFVITWHWIERYIRLRLEIDKGCVTDLLNFGGWLTISSIIGPVMLYFDRFILSALLGSKQVAFYTAPSELVMRLVALPSSVARTLFPRLTVNQSQDNVYWTSIFALALLSFVIVLPIFVFAEDILTLWLGNSFAGEPKWVLRILLIGFIFNAIAQIPFTQLQARGLSKTTAIVHCIEIIPYICVLFGMIKFFGVIGVALSWAIRMLVDFLVLLIIVQKGDIAYG